uniref:Integrase catalytic domain-containing protein n=1 Tax=Bracon brevicornis TaxID=1563983 RepID=A0A6V7JW40_9HYME
MCNLVNANKNTYQLWHARLGHIGSSKFLQIKRNNNLYQSNLPNNINPIEELCEACVYGKQACLPFSKERDRTHVKRPLFIIHLDACGPITPTTFDEKNYFVTFIDEFTHYTVIYLLKHKSEVLTVFHDYVLKVETHFNSKIAYLYCDNGTEYLSNEFKNFCSQKGIQYHLTVPHTPQQNSIAERINRTLVEKARTLLYGANLGKELWGEAVLTATYLTNLTPTKAIPQDKTPYELWHNRKPRLDHLRIFGSTVYVHDKNRKRKFDKKSIKGVLVGYHQNGYKVLMIESNKIILARDVIFDEINFKITRPNKHRDEVEREENSTPELQKNDDRIKISKTEEESKETDVLEISENQENISKENAKENDENEMINALTPEMNSHKNRNDLRRSERIKNLPAKSYDEENHHAYAHLIINKDIPKSFNDIINRED